MLTQVNRLRRYLETKQKLVAMLAMLFLFLMVAVPVKADGNANVPSPNVGAAFQVGYTTVQTTAIPTLALDPDVVTTGLFSGANIILVALGGIIFLIIGLSFGGKILEAVRNMVQGLRIG